MLRFSISASADNARNTASNVPSSRHLANRAYTDCHGPYTSGSSRHCAPLWAIQSIPLSIFRSSFRGRPRCPVLSGGSIAFTRSHCSFVNSYRFMYLFSHLHTTCAIFIFQTTPSRNHLKKVVLVIHRHTKAGAICRPVSGGRFRLSSFFYYFLVIVRFVRQWPHKGSCGE